MIFWHLGGTVALVRYAFRDPNMDLRLLLVGALLPDLIDKPLGRVLQVGDYESGQLWGHTLALSATLMVVILLATRPRSPQRRLWFPLAVGSLFHLVLDFMWVHGETFLWPFLGTEFSEAPAGNLVDSLRDNLTTWWVVAGEVAGFLYLAWMWRRAHLDDPEYRSLFWRTGRLTVPIGG
jgi:membrane-bound metal-dependent hydrolase YbcI (DUF457 family)